MSSREDVKEYAVAVRCNGAEVALVVVTALDPGTTWRLAQSGVQALYDMLHGQGRCPVREHLLVRRE
jgi:hypothetical protein